MITYRAPTLILSGLAAALLLAGCAEQMIRKEANIKLKEGQFEEAIKGLQAGVAEYRESATLRAGLVSARGEAVARLVTEIAQHRASGRFDDAEKSLQRALSLEPQNERLLALQVDVRVARRQRDRLNEANTLLIAGKKSSALRAVEAGLRDAPRQADLLALQRQLEMELRLDDGARALAETRPISLDFRNASLSTVLEAITRGSGVNFILDRDVKQDSRVTLYLRGARLEDAIDLVIGANQLARRIVDPKTVLIYPNTPEKQREHQEQVVRVFYLGNAEAKATAALLRSMLRIKDLFVDERANLIAIRENPEIVALAERLVALHDIGDAEVMLEVEILEVKTTRLTELGINFPSGFTLSPLAAAGGTGLTVNSLRNINSDRVGVSVAGLLVNLRREVGDFNVLANPRIRAKSREKAHILIGDKVPVFTATSSSTGFVAESVNYLDVGLKLDVEPVVSPDDDVTIKLALEVSTLASEVRTTAGSVAYQIGTRNAHTTLRLRDGETQLLAGLISNEDRATSNRVPGLGDLPVAGRLFSSQKDDVQRTELVLAITPRILRSAMRPDVSQAEMWVGTEMATRLRAAPGRGVSNEQPLPSVVPKAGRLVESSSAIQPRNTPQLPKGPAQLKWQAPAEVNAGEVFTVTLNLSSGAHLRGLPLEIAFPPQAFEVIDVAEGSFFKQAQGVTSFTQAVNPTMGRVGVGVLRGDESGAVGQGSVLTMRLKAKVAGSANLSLTSAKPISLSNAVPLMELPVLQVNVK